MIGTSALLLVSRASTEVLVVAVITTIVCAAALIYLWPSRGRVDRFRASLRGGVDIRYRQPDDPEGEEADAA